ncbi:MAG: hypothetical protein QOG04_1598 [Actinomycetota bacterium]|jgi:hypothetical protein|nr:hypothetical protein [Actinomycetota bacterium]
MDNRFEMMLADAGRAIDWPEPSTGFSTRVVARINQAPRKSSLRRFVPAFSALGVLVAAIVTFSPATRNAVADFIGIGGVHIEFGDEKDLPEPQPGAGLDLGDVSTLEDAQAALDFDIVTPSLPALGEPDEVYLESILPNDGMISLVYGERDGYELSGTSGVSVLITEFRANLARGTGFFKKMVANSTIEKVEVNGSPGYWISGGPHSFYYRANGRVSEEPIRLVENVLLWVQDGVTLRIETAGSLKQALEIARSLS